MTSSAITGNLKQRLLKHEGIKLKPYRCTAGKLSIGIGRNLDDGGITRAEAFYLLENDLKRCEKECSDSFVWFDGLDAVRKGVVIEMVFNLGLKKFLDFKRFMKALTIKDFQTAAQEMLNSRWALQVGTRSARLSQIMKTGKEV